MDDTQNLAAEICLMLHAHAASNRDGTIAVATVLLTSLMDSGLSKETSLEMLGKIWDQLEPTYKVYRQQQERLQ